MTGNPSRSWGRDLAHHVLAVYGVYRIVFAIALVGCVPGRSVVYEPVEREARARIGIDGKDVVVPATLDLDSAIRIAIARNRHLRAAYDELGVAASEVATATVLPPTEVDADIKRAIDGEGNEVEISVVQDLLDLLQLGQRRGIANGELRIAQLDAIAATIALATEVEIAFYDAIAVEELRSLAQTAFDAADASATLVERQGEAGNTTDLAIAREQEQRERLRIEIARYDQLRTERRTRLATLLGLDDAESSWSLAGTLPAPPATTPELGDLETAAVEASLDLASRRAAVELASARHRYAMVRTFLPSFGAGVAVARRDGGEWEAGPAVRIGIPIFDHQEGPRARAIAQERKARSEGLAIDLDLRADVKIIRSRVAQAFAEVHQLGDTVLPLRRRILAETVLHYNAMNATPFELLVARRDALEVSRQYIEALQRYWVAMAEARALRRGVRAMKEQP